eukprot:scaffold12546_cov110-Skeletonema_dohrnii-CCMP3373.AAC.7
MPITIAIVAAIAKAGCFLIGSLVHEVNELTKRFGVDEEAVVSRAPSLLIKDEKLGLLQETPKVPSSNALVLYASRVVVLTMSNDSLALESQFDVVENNPFSVLNNLMIFAAWYLTRCIHLMQSALRSFIPDMKVAISSLFGSVSESVVEKKSDSSILFLIQVNFSRLIAKVVIILKEAIHLLKSRTEKNISALLGQAFPAGIRGKETALPLCSVVGDSLPVNIGTCTLKNLTMTITCVKQALAIRFGHSTSLHCPLQLLGVKMTTLVCLLLFVSISVIGWSIPLMLFDGSKLEQGFLQHQNIPEAVLDLEAGAFSPIAFTSRLTSLPGDTSNSLISMESISNVVDLHSVSTAMGTIDRQADLNPPGLADYTLCMLLWQANDFSTASTPGLQSGYLFDDKAAAYSLAEWDFDATHCIQPGFRSGSALEYSLFHSSSGTATTHFDRYDVSAIVDEAFALSFISQALQNQSSVELGCFPSRSAPDGDISTMPMMIIIAAGSSEIFIINYLTRENIDGYSASMHADDRYSDLTAVRVHDEHADLDHYGLADYSLSLLLRSDNDFFTASSSGMHTDYFWNDKTAAALPLDWNIEATHRIQSESSLFISVLGDLSSERFTTTHFASVAVKAFDGYTAPTIADAAFTLTPSFIAQASQNQSSIESLGRSLPRSVSEEDTATSSMSMVNEVGPPQELSIFQNRERLPAPSDCTSGFAKPKASVSSVSISRPKSFFATAPSSLSFNALKDSTNLNIFCELHQLALMLLMLAYCNTDGIKDEPDDVASTSEISLGTDLDLEEAPDDEVIFIGEENGAEAEEVFSPITNPKPSKRELTALHSELGRHWKSPSKRRRRRSSRICSRPNFFEPS